LRYHLLERRGKAAPNKPMQPTPLRVDKTVAILTPGYGKNAFPIYHGGAADGQGVRRLQ
jgi:hypothetical protein